MMTKYMRDMKNIRTYNKRDIILLPLVISKFQNKPLMEMDLMYKYYIWISIK